MNDATQKALAEWNRLMEEQKRSYERELAKAAWEKA